MIKRGLMLSLMVIFLLVFLFFPQIKAEVKTGLNIFYNNVPPALIDTIPNQTWAKNTNITNAFDLDDYFYDNSTLTYSNSSVENISIVINGTTNQVSFYSDSGFQGLRNVTFTAFDGTSSTNSNTVTLNVTGDFQPPTWSNPSKDKTASQIFQNTIVTFSTTWQDNIALSSYIFSIKQESGWVNQSPSSFTGIQNTSSYSIQISAPSGINVEWRFYAFDSTGNLNSTNIQEFTVSTTPAPPSSTSDDEDDTTTTTTTTTASKTKTKIISDFKIDSGEGGFKIDIKQGFSGAVTIKITNIGNTDLSFNIEVDKLEEFEKIVSEKAFNLTAGESKTVTVEFTANRRLMPDIYYGTINVKTRVGTRSIPTVIVVKKIVVEFDLNINLLEESKSVRPGDIIKANITLTNIKEVEKRNITFYYAITDFKGKVIDSAFEEFTFTKRSVIMEKSLSLPQQIKRGEYIFFARAVSGKEIVLDSDVFKVGEKFSVAGFVKTNFIIFLLVLSSIIVAVIMMRHHKNKEKMRLLNLYLRINELNKLIKAGKHEEAIGVYVNIKSAYGEPVSETALKNKEELKKEMEKLAKKLDVEVLQKLKEKANETEKGEEGSEKEEQKETEKKPEEDKEKSEKVEEKPLDKDQAKTSEVSRKKEEIPKAEGKKSDKKITKEKTPLSEVPQSTKLEGKEKQEPVKEKKTNVKEAKEKTIKEKNPSEKSTKSKNQKSGK